jgi:hypothetical protein
MFGVFRKLYYSGPDDLLRGATIVTNNIKISGGVQGGAVSIGGDAENKAPVNIHYNPQTIEKIQSELSKAERELHSAQIDDKKKKDALEIVRRAKAEPTPDNIEKATKVLGEVNAFLVKAFGVGTEIARIASALGQAAGLI